MPEHLFAVAHELKLSVTLHMVRYYGLSDKGNQETIREMCTKYPDMRLVLAHAARGFNMFHVCMHEQHSVCVCYNCCSVLYCTTFC